MQTILDAIINRPTETVTGLGVAPLVFAFLIQAGVPPVVSAIIAVAVAFVPAAITQIVVAIRGTKT